MNTQTTALSNVSLDQFIGKKRKQLGALLVGAALLTGSFTGIPPAAASAPAVDTGGSGSATSETFSVPTQNEQSVALTESKEAPVVLLVSPANSGFGPQAF